MGQLKRRRPGHLMRPGQMLATLGSLRLTALLQHGGIWLAVTPELAELLNQCCTGQMDGGPGTAAEVAEVLEPLGCWDPKLPPELQAAAGASAAGVGSADPAPWSSPTPPPAPAPAPAQQQSGPAALRDGLDGEARGPSEGGGSSNRGAEAQDGPSASVHAAVPPDAMEVDRPTEAAGAEVEAPGTSAGVPDAVRVASMGLTLGAPPAAAGGFGGGPGRGGPSSRGRGRRPGWQPPPPYSPAAAGCPLVAVRLTLEEAFFLNYVLRCLQVYELQPEAPIPATSEHVRLLETEALWAACRAIRSNFVTSYVAYHHLKAKGWIPRSGLLYGIDYVVYQLHPVGCHSDFGVLVLPLGPGGRPAGPHTPALGWLDLQITNRLVNQVVKKLILLYLYEQAGGPDHTTTACLENFLVEERIVRRWVPDATRD